MKKHLPILFACLILLSCLPVRAEAANINEVQVRDDLIAYLLFPLIEKQLEKHYGELKQFYNAEVLKVKKLEPGSYDFEVTVQVTTFEGAHNPPNDLVTITFSNYHSLSWQVIDFKSRRIP